VALLALRPRVRAARHFQSGHSRGSTRYTRDEPADDSPVDRRPNANCDPYVVTRLIIETVCGAAEKRKPTLVKAAKRPARAKGKKKAA
jgi:hypothetical protein